MPEDNLPLTHSEDLEILMHRDAHFSGSFDIMLDYYKNRYKGVMLDFDHERILELSDLEKQMGTNLSATLLSGADAEKVAKAKAAYKNLRALYENPSKDKKYALLVADLILSEDEEAEEEIKAIVAEKGAIVRSLIDLLRAEDFYDPLMPGYGKAPLLAAKALGQIGDKRAIISLFEALGEGDFFDEGIELEALKAIGEPAKEFLLNVLKSHPINADNEKAALALIQFKEDVQIAKACFEMLQEKEAQKNLVFATYLVMNCENLEDTDQKDKLIKMGQDESLDKMLRLDIQNLTKYWTK